MPRFPVVNILVCFIWIHTDCCRAIFQFRKTHSSHTPRHVKKDGRDIWHAADERCEQNKLFAPRERERDSVGHIAIALRNLYNSHALADANNTRTLSAVRRTPTYFSFMSKISNSTINFLFCLKESATKATANASGTRIAH